MVWNCEKLSGIPVVLLNLAISSKKCKKIGVFPGLQALVISLSFGYICVTQPYVSFEESKLHRAAFRDGDLLKFNIFAAEQSSVSRECLSC